MEKMKVFGKQHLDFVSKEGQHVQGVKLHCITDVPNSFWEGSGYDSFFVSVLNAELYKLAVSLSVGAEIDCSFNRRRKVDSFTVCK